MKKILMICSLFTFCFTNSAHRKTTFNIGSQLLYARFSRNCFSPEKGFLAGPHFNAQFSYPWRIYLGLYFDALWKIGNFCSRDGLFLDVNTYEATLKIGFPIFNSEQSFSFSPYVGIGYFHVAREIECEIIRYKYNQIYVPFGFQLHHDISDHFAWGLDFFYRFDAYTRLKVTTPCLCDPCDCNIDLKRMHGAHVELPFTGSYRTDKRVTIQLQWVPTFDWKQLQEVDSCSCPSDIPIRKQNFWNVGTKAIFGIRF